MATTRPFDIFEVLDRISRAVEGFPRAALFELYDEGFRDPFQQLVACMISIRTLDETMLPIARQLLARAGTAAAMAALSMGEINELIARSTFHEQKAARISAIAKLVDREFAGALPCDFDRLVALPGVGPKCANLVLGIACGQPAIAVDIHVHRVTNRWGYVRASTPEGTMEALKLVLPQPYWVEINRLLVPFGKHICLGPRPCCSTCPVLAMCERRGVTRSQ
ncbi:MAG TPA: endonuclease III [Chloroflexota bacterium]|nr:endonuclease III [Chloroflexota bacterium]